VCSAYGGVEMAQMKLAHGKSPAMKAMARQIIEAQKKEIAQLEQWLAKQPAVGCMPHGGSSVTNQK
jgi:uncharacterized protein (DUF305 family)